MKKLIPAVAWKFPTQFVQRWLPGRSCRLSFTVVHKQLPSVRTHWPLILVALFFVTLGHGLVAEDENREISDVPRPNIVLIMADDLGEEALGSYGGESIDTPNLDALANSGTRFTHAYSTPRCSPSRATILTGRYTFRYDHSWGYLPPSEVTFGNVLRDAGYATAAAGKWQMSGENLGTDPLQPRKEGFNRYAFWAWHQGPRYFDPLVWQDGRLRDDKISHRYGPNVYTDFLIEHIRRNQGPHQRFLAYYPMVLPHFAKKPGQGHAEPKGPDGEYQGFNEMVRRIDMLVGQIVRTLERLDLRRRTLILFTSDNGTSKKVKLQVNGRTVKGGKGNLTNAGTHVPLIASWPGHVPAGRVSDALIDFSDVLPTLAHLAGADLPANRTIDGVSFAPQLLGSDQTHRPWIYTQWRDRRWVRNRAWKLYGDGTLYHMANDENETSPIQPDEGSPEAKAARKKLREAFSSLGFTKDR